MWLLAWRNLWRNRTRTFITGSAIALTFALQLISFGMGDAMYASMLQSAVKTAGGSVLVHADGYWLDPSSDKLVPSPDTLAATVRAVPGVEAVIPRVIVQGLLSSPRGNAGVRLLGIVPADEARLQDMGRFLSRGAWLDGDDERPLVLGKGLVEDLGVDLGDRVVLTATDPNGEMTRALFRLSGVLDTGSPMLDDAAAYTTLAMARSAVGLGDRVTQLGVVIDDDQRRAERRDAIARALDGRAAGLELLTWDEAMPEMVGFIEVDSRTNVMFMYLIFVIVLFGIANTFLMAVMERIRELGLLGALGMTPRRVAGLILTETFILAVLSLLIGLALAYAGHRYLAAEGLDMSQVMGDEMEISGVILEDMVLRSVINPVKWVSASTAVLVLVLASALYPAWRATRVEPAQAMRTFA